MEQREQKQPRTIRKRSAESGHGWGGADEKQPAKQEGKSQVQFLTVATG